MNPLDCTFSCDNTHSSSSLEHVGLCSILGADNYGSWAESTMPERDRPFRLLEMTLSGQLRVVKKYPWNFKNLHYHKCSGLVFKPDLSLKETPSDRLVGLLRWEAQSPVCPTCWVPCCVQVKATHPSGCCPSVIEHSKGCGASPGRQDAGRRTVGNCGLRAPSRLDPCEASETLQPDTPFLLLFRLPSLLPVSSPFTDVAPASESEASSYLLQPLPPLLHRCFLQQMSWAPNPVLVYAAQRAPTAT